MAYLHTNLVQDAMSLLGNSAYFRGTATGGSATTLLDSSSLVEKSEEDLIGGTIIVVRDAGGAGASPEGKWGTVSAFDATTFAMTIPTVTDLIAAGDEYMHISPQYPLTEIRNIVRLGLQRAGTFMRWDTSITTADDQTEYTLPVTLKLRPSNMSVYVEQEVGDTDNNRWRKLSGWDVIPSAAGSAATLVLPQLVSGRTIGIKYETLHPTLYNYNDVVDEAIHPVYAQLLVAAELFAWTGITDDNRDQANKVLADLAVAERRYKIQKPKRGAQLLTWQRDRFGNFPDEDTD